jgi:hypothetical protein
MNQYQPPLCTVIKGKGGSVEIVSVPEDQALGIDPGDFNVYVNKVKMTIRISLENQKPVELDDQVKGLYGKPIVLLKKLMMKPDRFLAPYDIGNIGEYDESFFVRDNLQQYSRKLRKILFGKSGHKIIQTARKPYRLCLTGDISYCFIEYAEETHE